MPWSEAAAQMLLEMLKGRSQQEAAEAAGVSIATWQRTVAGAREPTISELERLAGLLPADGLPKLLASAFGGTSFAQPKIAQTVATVTAKASEGFVQVPVHDVQVAAGAGRLIDRLPPPIYHWTFSRDWMEANLKGVGQLVMVEVSGSSQEPELSDGDLVAVDLDQSRLREGLFVVRLDDLLVIKHIQVDGRIVRLMSRNPLYDPVEIDLHEPGIDERFEVVGRAVWASKML
ncbi:LexA family transcriptional regulator [Sphingomonas sp. SORGH_AS_0879]|uniref:XRE family transcriptional regulator n=1 Tax=Sphingomonas sp. SORGH_AS_0879 TaxID=3041790 RepID=UPI0027864CFE|nr:LexA family transcriptional regulator [Sphingomonas sp. SORGH_AS_0879]MDQ1229290.1 phage repressor protein C with HTH and peptisase S24 domain [Sphingomonas sp. SORGH_AS_0879]